MANLHNFVSFYRSIIFGILVLIFVKRGLAIPVDNGVLGEPEVECGSNGLTVNFNTINDFQGHVYVKGLYDNPGCRNDQTGRQVTGLSVAFNTCGLSRQRSLNPQGVYVSITLVISFHPLFLTKVDRAYRIQCFYMEAPKSVAQGIEVSMLTTNVGTEQVLMPVCRYEVLAGGPSGPIITYALIGDQVYHKFTCDTETVNTFCMIVHSCYVDDTAGDKVDLLTPEGCAIDEHLLGNLDYVTDLMAGKEAHVFKYADRPSLYFQCQVTITIKEPFIGSCPRPQCGPSIRAKRSSAYTFDHFGTIDVSSQTISALDIDELPRSELDSVGFSGVKNPVQMTSFLKRGLCLSPAGFSISLCVVIFLVITVISVCRFLLIRKESASIGKTVLRLLRSDQTVDHT